MNKIIFNGIDHQERYKEYLEKMPCQDDKYRAVAYLLALIGNRAEDIFDFKNHHIIPEGMSEAWQTGTTSRATALIFSMWNGYTINPEKNNIMSIFGYVEWDEYYIEALKLYCYTSIKYSKIRLKI